MSSVSPSLPAKIGQMFLEIVCQTQEKALKVANASIEENALVTQTENLIENAASDFNEKVQNLGKDLEDPFIRQFACELYEKFYIFKFYDQIEHLVARKETEMDKDFFSELGL